MNVNSMSKEQLDQFGKDFVSTYYQTFDSGIRESLTPFYVPDAVSSQLNFEGKTFRGQLDIIEKLKSLSFRQIAHDITSVDTMTTLDQGVLLTVLGRFRTDDDPILSFTQAFYLKAAADGTWYILNDNFRIILHNSA
ncbi:hypothetical protein GJ496_006237 [Pomphorhynchus laevis]|nr:hypothetical protein GJ496_006237 [Pomphorhynchus laevis]